METAGNHVDLAGINSAFAPEYHRQEIFEMAQKLYKTRRFVRCCRQLFA